MIEDTIQYKYWKEHERRLKLEWAPLLGGMTGTRPSKEVFPYPEKWSIYGWYWYMNTYEQLQKDLAVCQENASYMPAKEFDRSLQNQALLEGFDNWGEKIRDNSRKWKEEMDNRDKTFPGGWPPRLKFRYGKNKNE